MASSVGCIEGTVNIYGSSYTSLDVPTKVLVCFMLVPTHDECNLCESKVVAQTELFAIAVIMTVPMVKTHLLCSH